MKAHLTDYTRKTRAKLTPCITHFYQYPRYRIWKYFTADVSYIVGAAGHRWIPLTVGQ